MRLSFSFLAAGALLFLGTDLPAAAPDSLKKAAAEFSRTSLNDPATEAFITRAGNLSGKNASSPKDQPPVVGAVEYDFEVTQPGWFVLHVQPDGGGHEFLFDGKDLLYGFGSSRVGNVWLDAGAHTLRIARNFWTGFGPITEWRLEPAGAVKDRLSVRSGNRWNVLRKGEVLPVAVSFGDLTEPATLTLVSRKMGGGENAERVEVVLPAGRGKQEVVASLPTTEEGIFEVSYLLNGQELPGVLPRMRYGVVDTTPVKPADEDLKKTLVAEIDCVERAPDYFKGGETRVVTKPWGSYRESGDVGYLQHMNANDPSWFAYRFKVDEPGALYWLEFDYPDDARRTFLVVPRSGKASLYAGPATGPDTGREFSLTNRLQTMGMYVWPPDGDLRCVVMQPQSGLRAAVSKIRIYKVEGGIAPLPVSRKGGRDFFHWYEEGSSYLGFFGATGKSLSDMLLATDNWGKIMADAGASVLLPTVNIYQPAMYPSAHNPTFTDSNTFDSVRIIELICEKYGLKFAGEFHPEGRPLETISAQGAAEDSIYQFNRLGESRTGSDRPKFNFLHPAVEKYAIDLIGEFADRYGDSPAFAGASIRLMEWQNTGFGNFGSLDWGYGDFTIGLFEKETGTKIPVNADDPERFGKRYDWLKANAAAQWEDWRCRKAAEFFAKVRDRLRAKNPEAVLYLTYFLTPDRKSSDTWYGGFADFPKQAGIDPSRIGQLAGVELISALVSHGRRSSEAADQRARDGLVQPGMMRVLASGAPARFLSGQAYFEANEKVIPPSDLGYPANAPHGWVSGNVDPSGRHYLERFALQVAETDALAIGDGGNAYTVGQPLLREFLREFRSLPQAPFRARPDARDPVAVWELDLPEEFLFYAVNRERYPVKVRMEFDQPGTVKSLAHGTEVPLSGNTMEFTLEPYALKTFAAASGRQIKKVSVEAGANDVAHVRKMTEFLQKLAADVSANAAGSDLGPAQKKTLADAAQEASECLKEGRFWRARTLQESQRLRDIYERCGVVHPLLDQNGPLKIPEKAVPAAVLATRPAAKRGTLVKSETISPNWIGQNVFLASGKELAFTIETPVDGKYHLGFGLVSGEGSPEVSVHVDGRELGTLNTANKGEFAAALQLPEAISLTKGRHEISLVAKNGRGPGLLYFETKPVYQDIVGNRWMMAGPFVVAEKGGAEAEAAIVEAVKSQAFPPEVHRKFDVPFDTAAGEKKWRRLGGLKDFIDFRETTGHGLGSIHYAVTYLVSPEDREVELSYSSDYFAKIWLGGKVLEDFYRPAGHPEKGQKKQIVTLKKGVNELLVKVGSGSEGNGFWFAFNNPGDVKIAPMVGNTPAGISDK